MKSNYFIVLLILVSLSLSFCSEKSKNKKQLVSIDIPAKGVVKVKKSDGKCCSTIPARFPIKNAFVPQPEKLN